MRVEIAKWAVKWYGTIPWDEMTDAQREVWLLEAAELLALIGEDREPVGYVSEDVVIHGREKVGGFFTSVRPDRYFCVPVYATEGRNKR